MPSILSCTRGALVLSAALLSACATSVSVSDMYTSNFGRQVLPHFDASVDPDPMVIANGLYTPQPLRDLCYSCASRFNWAGWTP